MNTIHSLKTKVIGEGASTIHAVMLALSFTDAGTASDFVMESADELKMAIMQSPMNLVKVLISATGPVTASVILDALKSKQMVDPLFKVMCTQIQGIDIVHIDDTGKPLDSVKL